MSDAFSNSGTDVINRQLSIEGYNQDIHRINEHYEIDRCAEWIIFNNFKRVALQFPDELHSISTIALKQLQMKVNADIYILADTYYGSCCVDEVAAEHNFADCIIHFGKACLSPTCKLPVLYIFGQKPLDIPNLISSLKQTIDDVTQLLLIIYDVEYHHAAETLKAEIGTVYKNFIIADLIIPMQDSRYSLQIDECTIKSFGRYIELLEHTSIKDYIVCYIGNDEDQILVNWMIELKECVFYCHNPTTMSFMKQNINVNRYLCQRFYLVEKAKDAMVIGLLVGTLGVANYKDILKKLKNMIKLNGKKSYTFVVGKLNAPKLANFLEIDIYVLVSCPQNALFSSKDYYRPIITPHELELACNKEVEWSGNIITDYRRLLPGGDSFIDESKVQPAEADVSLVTGKMRGLETIDSVSCSSTTLLAYNENNKIISSEFLNNRNWKGLQIELGATPVSKAELGRSGIAIDYGEKS